MTVLGYARVSTAHQNADMQMQALTAAGADRIWTEHMSGSRDDRPELTALLDYARAGDVLMVWRLDRLGRSLPHLLTIASDLQDRGIELRSLTEAIDTTTPGGRLVFHVFGAVAEFERAIAAERTAAGVAAARAAGRHPGRPALPDDTIAAVKALDHTGTPRAQIARTLGISRSSVYRCLDEQPSSPVIDPTPGGTTDPDWQTDREAIDHSVLDPWANHEPSRRTRYGRPLNIATSESFDDPLPESEIALWEGCDDGGSITSGRGR